MGTFLLILLVVLLISLLIFQPNIDYAELYEGENWTILWYNHYYIFKGKLKCERNWTPLYSFERYD